MSIHTTYDDFSLPWLFRVKSRRSRRDQSAGTLTSVRAVCIALCRRMKSAEHGERDELLRIACPLTLGPGTASSSVNSPP
jgi:hypothetical protein